MTTIILPTTRDLADMYELEEAASRADLLSPVSAGILEVLLKRNPLDLVNRARLLGFYHRYYWKTRISFCKQFREQRVQHILWFIKNAPDCRFAGDLYLACDKKSDRVNYDKIAGAWEAAIRQSPENSQIPVNAALFYFKHDKQRCTSLLQSIKDGTAADAWVKALASELGLAEQRSSADQSLTSPTAALHPDLRALCNRSSLHRAFSIGREMSAISAETLMRVLSVYPDDVTARAELVAYYGHRCRRFNILGHDPEFEHNFVTHVLWFISHALGAIALMDIRVPELTPTARRILCEAVTKHRPNAIDKDAEENIAKFAERLRAKTDSEKRRSARTIRKRGRKIDAAGALDEIAIEPLQLVEFGEKPKGYSLTEWANDCCMDSAKLTGSYGWVAPHSIEHLDEMLGPDSIDLYNRAKIVGYYREPEELKNRDQKLRALYVKQLHWLIAKVPDCEFLKEHYWVGMKTDEEIDRATRKVWAETIKARPNAEACINAALAHCETDSKAALSFVASALAAEPDNLMATALLNKLKKQPQKITSRELLKKHDFEPGRKSSIITKASRRIDLTGAWLFGRGLPNRSVWTAEQTVSNNPNELAMRAELLGYHGDIRYCFAIEGRDPKYSIAHLPHLLWFIENMPETIGARGHGDYYQDPAGYRALVAAWKQQLEAYPTNVAVAYSASWIFSGDRRFFKQGIAEIKRAIKLHPKNKKLKGRLEQLKRLAGIG